MSVPDMWTDPPWGLSHAMSKDAAPTATAAAKGTGEELRLRAQPVRIGSKDIAKAGAINVRRCTSVLSTAICLTASIFGIARPYHPVAELELSWLNQKGIGRSVSIQRMWQNETYSPYRQILAEREV